MAKKISDQTVTTSVNSDSSLFDIIDNKIESERLKNLNRQAEEVLFDNSHQTEDLRKVYDELDQQSLKASIQDDAYDSFNPFYGDKDALNSLKRHQYTDIVSRPNESTPTLEIKEEIKTGVKKKTSVKRKKLWLVVGGVCIALFLSLFTYNMVSINSLARKNANTQNQIAQQEQVLEKGMDEYKERLEDLDLEAVGMVEADLGAAQGVDLSVKNLQPQYTIPTNFWDKVCNFFAKLFGR